jgi:hypothetical protein
MPSYQALKKKLGQERVFFGKRLIKARAKERNTTVEAQATQLKNAFSQSKLAQQVKRLTGKQRGAPLRSVNVPANNSNIDRVECTDKLSIEQAFACEGTQRFSQTNGTPLMQKEFVQQAGYLAELPGAEEILNGIFVPEPGMDPYAVQFLSHLKMEIAVSTQPPISKVISTQSYQDSWKKMKPNTSSSPFGPSFVHYIAGSRDQQIAEFDATIANIPYASGYSPEVWIKMVDVLIPKKTTSPAIEKLRIIVLFHALFNMNNNRNRQGNGSKCQTIEPNPMGSLWKPQTQSLHRMRCKQKTRSPDKDGGCPYSQENNLASYRKTPYHCSVPRSFQHEQQENRQGNGSKCQTIEPNPMGSLWKPQTKLLHRMRCKQSPHNRYCPSRTSLPGPLFQ